MDDKKKEGEVEQVNHYYPYGGIMAESTNESVQRYKYNGKELDRMHGLDWHDYEATNLKVSIKSLFRRIYNSVLNMF